MKAILSISAGRPTNPSASLSGAGGWRGYKANQVHSMHSSLISLSSLIAPCPTNPCTRRTEPHAAKRKR